VSAASTNGRLLVTGGAGFIGANLIRMLLKRGYRLTVLDDFSKGREAYLAGLPLEVVRGDLLDRDLVEKTVAGHDGIVHLAAQTGVPSSLADPRHDCAVNVLGTLNVLEAARHKAVPRLVFASSNAPLGRQNPPAEENKAALPVSPYGASKLAGEAYCLAYQGSWGLRTVVLRFGNVYGPFSMHKSSVVARFFKDISTQRRIIIDGDGQQTRDFIYVEDLCEAIIAGLRSEISGEVFQIATGQATSVAELAELVQTVSGIPAEKLSAAARNGDVRESYSAIAKAARMLGWRPDTNLEEGLRQTWRWFRTQGREPLAG
jgi:UDP-glucose 4-epimerase